MLGGGIGAVLRYIISQSLARFHLLPFGTMVANLLGSFLICLFFALGFTQNELQLEKYNGLIMIGFFGALTTYSTFAYDIVFLYQNQNYKKAFAYGFISLVGAMFLGLLGFTLPFIFYE